MQYIEGSQKTFVSTSDLSASTNQFVAVKLDSTAGQIVVATAGTDKIIGVLMNTPKALDNAVVRLRSCVGTLPAIAGGTLAIGDACTATTAGKVIATTTSGDQILGYATRVAASGDFVELLPSTGKY